MPVSVVAVLMILTTVLLSACQQQQTVAIEDRSGQYYGRNAMTQMASSHASSITFQSAATDTIASVPLTAPTMHNTSSAMARSAAPAFTNAMTSNWSWPVQGQVTERFGKQAAGIANEGISIAAADGAPIKAAAGGEIAYVGSNVRDYGNMVIVRHPGGELTSYAHAKEILVNKGDRVLPGDVLGYVGKTGNAKTPQLHFAMREGNHAIDPMGKLPSQIASR